MQLKHLLEEINKTQKVKVWDSINVNLDPEQKENIMSGKLFQFTCDECGFTTRVQYPCLYHDMDKNLMIYCIPNFSGDTKVLDKMLNKLKSDSPENSMENYKENSLIRVFVCWFGGLGTK